MVAVSPPYCPQVPLQCGNWGIEKTYRKLLPPPPLPNKLFASPMVPLPDSGCLFTPLGSSSLKPPWCYWVIYVSIGQMSVTEFWCLSPFRYQVMQWCHKASLSISLKLWLEQWTQYGIMMQQYGLGFFLANKHQDHSVLSRCPFCCIWNILHKKSKTWKSTKEF